MKFMFVDPGETTGWVIMNDDLEVLEHGHTQLNDVGSLAEKAKRVDVLVVEKFTWRPGNAMVGREAVAEKVITLLESAHGEVIKQDPCLRHPRAKQIALKLGTAIVNKHELDAFAHAVHYFLKERNQRMVDTLVELLSEDDWLFRPQVLRNTVVRSK